MKKTTILFAALLAMPFAYANNAPKKMEKAVVEEKQMTTSSTVANAVPSMLNLMEENQNLMRENQTLAIQMENLNDRLEYVKMMKPTLDYIQSLVLEDRMAETRSEVAYGKMMFTTLINLNKLAAK